MDPPLMTLSIFIYNQLEEAFVRATLARRMQHISELIAFPPVCHVLAAIGQILTNQRHI